MMEEYATLQRVSTGAGPAEGTLDMTGPWASYGRENGPDDSRPREPGPEQNPYLRDQTVRPQQMARHSVDPVALAADAYWQNPVGSNPYLSATDGRSGPQDQRPAVPNPYLRNPYLQDPGPPDPFTGARYPSDPYGQPSYSPAAYGRNTYGPQSNVPAGYPPGIVPAGPPSGRNWSLIAAVIVMVIIVVAAAMILFNRSDSTTATLPTTAPATSPGPVGVLPAPSAEPSKAATPPSISRDATTNPAPTSPSPTQAALVAARAAATAWVDAINRDQVTPARALSCGAVKPKIDAAFVKTVAGSIKITSVTLDDPAAARPTGTLAFTYQKTTDAARKQDHLGLVLESGRWKVCS